VQLPPLTEGTLVRRYKRFLADVQLADGRLVTARVANTGSLLGCAEPGLPVWLADSTARAAKYNWVWMLVKPGSSLVCVDTGVPNRVVLDAAVHQLLPSLSGYLEYLPEVPYGTGSRADLCCRVHPEDMLRRCWVEVKSTTLARGRVAQFPDAVTARGLRHLKELQRVVAQGERAVQLFFVQRGDCRSFAPADDIDSTYGTELRRAAAAGVEILACQARITKRIVEIDRLLPVRL
jgi:sugar fermentation stimulation protein A